MYPRNLARPNVTPPPVIGRGALVLIPADLARPSDGWRELLHVFALLGQPAAVCDAVGAALHVTDPLRMLLADAPGCDAIPSALRQAAGRERPSEWQLDAAAGRCRIRALPGADGAGPFIALVDRLAPPLPSDSQLASRHGLTRAEARVARLIADGRTNTDVARTLTISTHTAKRHTERVLQKLAVGSRRDVAARLRR